MDIKKLSKLFDSTNKVKDSINISFDWSETPGVPTKVKNVLVQPIKDLVKLLPESDVTKVIASVNVEGYHILVIFNHDVDIESDYPEFYKAVKKYGFYEPRHRLHPEDSRKKNFYLNAPEEVKKQISDFSKQRGKSLHDKNFNPNSMFPKISSLNSLIAKRFDKAYKAVSNAKDRYDSGQNNANVLSSSSFVFGEDDVRRFDNRMQVIFSFKRGTYNIYIKLNSKTIYDESDLYSLDVENIDNTVAYELKRFDYDLNSATVENF